MRLKLSRSTLKIVRAVRMGNSRSSAKIEYTFSFPLLSLSLPSSLSFSLSFFGDWTGKEGKKKILPAARYRETGWRVINDETYVPTNWCGVERRETRDESQSERSTQHCVYYFGRNSQDPKPVRKIHQRFGFCVSLAPCGRCCSGPNLFSVVGSTLVRSCVQSWRVPETFLNDIFLNAHSTYEIWLLPVSMICKFWVANRHYSVWMWNNLWTIFVLNVCSSFFF